MRPSPRRAATIEELSASPTTSRTRSRRARTLSRRSRSSACCAEPELRADALAAARQRSQRPGPAAAARAELRGAGHRRARPVPRRLRRHAVRLAGDLRRAGAQPRPRLLDLPQPQRHQPAPLHPGHQPAARRDRRRRRLLQRAASTTTATIRSTSRACAASASPAPYGRDGRFASPARLHPQRDRQRVRGRGADARCMLDALVAYMLEFDFLPAPYLDRDGTLNELASAAARRGEALFNQPFAQMDGRACASCHVPRFALHRQPRAQHRLGRAELCRRAQRRLRHADAARAPTTPRPTSTTARCETLARRGRPGSTSRFELGLSARASAPTSPPISRRSAPARSPTSAFDEREHAVPAHGRRADDLPQHARHADPGAGPREPPTSLLRTVAADLAADASAMTNRAALEPRCTRWPTRLVAAARRDRGGAMGRGRERCGRRIRTLERQYASGDVLMAQALLSRRRLLAGCARPLAGALPRAARARRGRRDPDARLHSAGEPREAPRRHQGDHRLARRARSACRSRAS